MIRPDEQPWESRYTGLFTGFGPIAPLPHDPQVPMWSGRVPQRGALQQAQTASGAGWDPDAARAACVGEAIERLACCPLRQDQLVEAAHGAFPLDEEALAPERLVMFHEEQYAQPGFPFPRFTADTVCQWACFREARSGRPVWVPADLGFLSVPGGHRLCPSVSTGLSCGRPGDPVLLRGLQEVIERDAVLGAWWDRYPLEEWPEADVLSMLPGWVGRRVLRPGLRYRFYRVRTPLSGHVCVVTMNGEQREGPCFSIGAACRESRRASWMKALLEAIQGLHYVRYLKRERRTAGADGHDELNDFPDHAVFYSLHQELLQETVLCRASAPEPDGAGSVEGLDLLAERLGPLRPVLFRDMTAPWLCGEGWRVLRVVVPGLQPLHGNHRFAHLGGPLWAPRGLAEWGRTPPHPFP